MNNLNRYLKELTAVPKYTSSEKKALLVKARSGDDRARAKFLEAHLPFVVFIAKKMKRNTGLDLLDLIQQGNLGLCHALNLYDPKKGEFLTYSRFWISKHILSYISSELQDSEQGTEMAPIDLISATDYEDLYRSLDILDTTERYIIQAKYGIGMDKVKVKDIAINLGLSRVWVNKLKNQAIKKLNGELNGN